LDWYPDLVLQSSDARPKLLGVVEVETGESVNHLEAMSQWATFGRLRAPLHLYVPVSSVDAARRLCASFRISVAEVWAYNALGDEILFALVHRLPTRAATGGGASKAATPTRRAASKRTAQSVTKARRAAAPKSAARKTVKKRVVRTQKVAKKVAKKFVKKVAKSTKPAKATRAARPTRSAKNVSKSSRLKKR
jgi:hypothetical protein